ncbi:MAG: tripartite tricarboxylate transporter substrate binding protein [Betaproteobacteria bacterium]|nr:tripartite tricarboxylate transporter substrate binding protein [Betaproteobacteria bacterium]
MFVEHTIRAMLTAVAMGAATHGFAQYPVKPIQMMVSSTPGAGTDLVGRTVADKLAERMGVAVVVGNNGGAAGLIAAEAFKRAAPDGHAILFTNDNLVLMMALGSNKGVDVLRDFELVAPATDIDFYLVVSGEALTLKGAQDLVRLAKDRAGKLSYASPGVGAPHHLGMELFKQQTGVDILHVPYKGMGPAMPDFVAGRVQVTMTGFPAVASYAGSGKIRVLAVAASRRSSEQPEVPTLREAGIPNVEIQGYNYLVAPLGAPAAVVARLNTEINEVLRMPQVRSDLAKRGTVATGGSPADLRSKLQTELEKWTKVVKVAGIKPE